MFVNAIWKLNNALLVNFYGFKFLIKGYINKVLLTASGITTHQVSTAYELATRVSI